MNHRCVVFTHVWIERAHFFNHRLKLWTLKVLDLVHGYVVDTFTVLLVFPQTPERGTEPVLPSYNLVFEHAFPVQCA